MDTAATPLSQWLARLETVSSREIDLGLERVSRVLERLALPPALTVLHVAGTNGKGSSVAMLESLLRPTGAQVGSYTSPHILRYNERICVDGQEADDDRIIAAFERIESVRDGEELTYFEFGTLAALVVFAEAGCDTLLLEIGLGGRLDAVNAVEPTAGLITNIGLDHCAWLGEDIELPATDTTTADGQQPAQRSTPAATTATSPSAAGRPTAGRWASARSSTRPVTTPTRARACACSRRSRSSAWPPSSSGGPSPSPSTTARPPSRRCGRRSIQSSW